jgi:SET domain
LQGLFVLKWDEFDNHIRFPLHTVENHSIAAPCSNATKQVKETHGNAATPGKEVAKPPSKEVVEPPSKKVVEPPSKKVAKPPIKEVIESPSKPYAIRAIAGKGKGLVATTRITKGTRLLSEIPIFKVPRDNPDSEALQRIVANEVKSLNDDHQRAFFDLTNIHGNAHSESLGIARTNVLPLGSKARFGGLFLEASRINHSCRHNAQNTWNENIGRLTIHALRDIEVGQEITITYLASTAEYVERQHFLKEKFKFACTCELCSLSRAQRKRSDSRLRKLQAIDNSIGEFFWGGLEPEEALHLLRTMFDLFKEEGIWDASIKRAYKDAYDIAIESDDESRARVFAERAYGALRVIEGDDSPLTMEMKQAAEKLPVQTPQGMNETEFENWLWMLNAH